jgi:formate dehydrogenase (coenzyme F420) beta subunit
MTTNAILPVQNGNIVESLRTFLRGLLEKKHFEALLVALEMPAEGRAVMTLVRDPGLLKHANPLAPVMLRNAAQIVAEMTRLAPSRKKVAVVLRSCELRALVELVKLKQASLENLTLIGLDCYGTYSATGYREYCRENANSLEPYLKSQGADARLRQACRVCEYPAPLNGDILIGLVGMDLNRGLLVQGLKPEAEKIISSLGLSECAESDLKSRETALAGLKARRQEARDRFFAQLKNEVVGLDNLLSTLAPCINCHNCRVLCPICYCKECFFDSPTFEWEADKYLGWAEKKGALKMPEDTLLYHLTRLNHMVASCVGCGMCQEACPHDIPVFTMFRLVGAQVQSDFNYVPGRSLEEEPPLTVFREDELGEIGK